MLHGIAAAHDLAATSAVPQFVAYSALVTGAPNGFDDYPIRLTSFQAGLYSGSPSYASATMGYTLEVLTALNARPDGELVVYQNPVFSDGATGTHELARFNLDDVRYQRGARSSSITITASRQSTNTSPVDMVITNASVIDFELQADGNYAINLSPVAAWPYPADQLLYGGRWYDVLRVDYVFGASTRTLRATLTQHAQDDIFATETDQAIRLFAVQIKPAGMASEIDSGPLVFVAEETDTALALTGSSVPTHAALETDTAYALTSPAGGGVGYVQVGYVEVGYVS